LEQVAPQAEKRRRKWGAQGVGIWKSYLRPYKVIAGMKEVGGGKVSTWDGHSKHEVVPREAFTAEEKHKTGAE